MQTATDLDEELLQGLGGEVVGEAGLVVHVAPRLPVLQAAVQLVAGGHLHHHVRQTLGRRATAARRPRQRHGHHVVVPALGLLVETGDIADGGGVGGGRGGLGRGAGLLHQAKAEKERERESVRVRQCSQNVQ